jgi:very-short-patch-repair endonuclease
LELGLTWWEWSRFQRERFQHPLSTTFAFVATHNHFVLDRGGKVFNRSAPVIKLPAGASEDDHLALIGLLNSSTACFWMKQVFYPKGGDHVGQEGARVRKTLWDERYEYTGTGLKLFPVTDEKPLDLARELDRLARELAACSPAALLAKEELHHEGTKGTKEEQSQVKESSCPSCLRGEIRTAADLRHCLDQARDRAASVRRRMIALQEELDWRCYRLYGVTSEDLCYVPSPQTPLPGGEGLTSLPSPQTPLPGGEGLTSLPSPQAPLRGGEGHTLLPSPAGRGAGGEGNHYHGVLPQDLLMNARELRKGQTDAEALLWLLLRDRRLAGFKFRRQHPVPPYVLDFYCHEKRLAVELDGGQHAEQVTKDERRMRELAKQGIRVLRFWDNQVLGEIGAVLEALWSALYEEEGRDSPHPEPLSRGARGFAGDQPR